MKLRLTHGRLSSSLFYIEEQLFTLLGSRDLSGHQAHLFDRKNILNYILSLVESKICSISLCFILHQSKITTRFCLSSFLTLIETGQGLAHMLAFVCFYPHCPKIKTQSRFIIYSQRSNTICLLFPESHSLYYSDLRLDFVNHLWLNRCLTKWPYVPYQKTHSCHVAQSS